MSEPPQGQTDGSRPSQPASSETRPDPFRISNEALKSGSRDGKGKSDPEQASELEPIAPDDRPDLPYETKKETTRREERAGEGGKSRFQQSLQRGRDLISRASGAGRSAVQKLGERYPETKQILKPIGDFIRSEGRERVEDAAKRQALSSWLPGWANTASAAYDGWNTYKGLKEFIQHARQHPELKPSRIGSEPYHQVVEAGRQKQINALHSERNTWLTNVSREDKAKDSFSYDYGQGKPAYLVLYEQGRHPHQQRIEKILSKISNIEAKRFSLEEKLSQWASRTDVQTYLRDSQIKATEHEKALLKSSAGDRYHWLFHQTEKELGQGYLDPVKNPKGIIAFERFAHEHLQVSGFSRQEVKDACSQGLACHVLTEGVMKDRLGEVPNKPYEDKVRGQVLESLERRFDHQQSKDLATQRTKTEIHQNANPIARSNHLTEGEKEIHSTLRDQAREYAKARIVENRDLSQVVLEEYQLGKGHNPDFSALQQFLLQHGREVQKGHQEPHIGDITYMLHAAGHRRDEMVFTLQHLHPQLNQSKTLAEQEYGRVLQFTKGDAMRQEEMKVIQEHKQLLNLHEEKRLDHLPFKEERAFSQQPHDKPLSGQRTQSAAPSHNRTESRDQEMEIDD